MLADNSREFSGIQEHQPYEFLLAMEDIAHRTTKLRSPRTNGFVERVNCTLLKECFRLQGQLSTCSHAPQARHEIVFIMRSTAPLSLLLQVLPLPFRSRSPRPRAHMAG